MKHLHNPSRHRFSLTAAAALTVSALAISLCAALSAPAFAWFRDTASGPVQSMQSATYFIEANRVDENGELLSNPTELEIVPEDTYYYTVKARGTASTGYAQVDVTSGDTTATYYISPIPQNKTVNLVIQVASGSGIAFSSCWGAPQADSSVVVAPVSTYSMEEDAPLMAFLEISQTRSIEYTVPERATLEAIAGHYRVSPEDVLIFNGIDALTPGETILIPNPATDTPYEPRQEYVVVEGDTLQKIADAYGVPLLALCHWNGLEVDTVIYQGMKLTIPAIYETETPEPEVTEPESTEPEATEPEATEPEATEPEATEPEATEPEATEPEATEPEATEPEATEPETTETTDSEAAVDEEIREEVDETVYVNGVPQYFQSDYPDVPYADGTVKTSGCSVTCLTMVANAVTGYDYTVDELADYFGGRAVNNMERLELGSQTLGLNFYKSENWDYTWAALQEGKIVVALMDGIEHECLFTTSQHFIVLTGLTEDGERILVNDPNKGNYEIWNLKDGFENGFTPNDLLLGYSGAWVYDRTLEIQPERYSEVRTSEYYVASNSEDGVAVSRNYPEIRLTDAERELLARVIWVEAQGECAEGQQAIAEVVFNRMLSTQFGDTLNDVIYSEGQFRSVPFLEDAKPTQAQYQAIDRALYGDSILPKNVYYFATFATNSNIYQQIGNHFFCF